jgi:putative ABC transport system permease protein
MVGVVLIGISTLLSNPEYLQFSVLAGFIPPLVFITGVLCATPLFTETCIRLLQRYAEMNACIPLSLASSHILATLRRTAVSIAALSVTLGTALSIVVLIHSFRSTVSGWIAAVTTADLYISANEQARGSSAALPTDLQAFVKSLSGIRAIDSVSAIQQSIDGAPAEIRASGFGILASEKRLPLFAGTLPASFPEDETVAFVSEAFARKHGTTLESSLTLYGEHESRTFTVLGIFQDYTTEHGVVLISRRNFSSLFPLQKPTGISLYVQPDVSVSDLADKIETEFNEAGILIRDRQALRSYVQEVFDQTFKVTYVLQAVTLCIAIVVLINTTLMLILERSNDIAVLRAIGVSATSIRRMLTLETLLIGSVATGVGTITGTGLSLFLVYVVNVFFFGWLVSFSIPWVTVLSMILSGLVLSIVIGATCSLRQRTTTLQAGGVHE